MARFKGCYKNEYARYLMAQCLEQHHDAAFSDPLVGRFDEIRTFFKFNDLEMELIKYAYVRRGTVFCCDPFPSRRGTANRMPRLNFYAMAIDRSVAEVKGYDHYEFFMAARDEAECPPEFKD